VHIQFLFLARPLTKCYIQKVTKFRLITHQLGEKTMFRMKSSLLAYAVSIAFGLSSCLMGVGAANAEQARGESHDQSSPSRQMQDKNPNLITHDNQAMNKADDSKKDHKEKAADRKEDRKERRKERKERRKVRREHRHEKHEERKEERKEEHKEKKEERKENKEELEKLKEEHKKEIEKKKEEQKKELEKKKEEQKKELEKKKEETKKDEKKDDKKGK
jgi:hypothetical protein